MNKRQCKKKFKKEYGFNPPSKRKIKAFTEEMEKIKKHFEKFVGYLKKVSEKLKEQIRNMPEEEFERRLSEMTKKQRKWAREIRQGQ